MIEEMARTMQSIDVCFDRVFYFDRQKRSIIRFFAASKSRVFFVSLYRKVAKVKSYPSKKLFFPLQRIPYKWTNEDWKWNILVRLDWRVYSDVVVLISSRKVRIPAAAND